MTSALSGLLLAKWVRQVGVPIKSVAAALGILLVAVSSVRASDTYGDVGRAHDKRKPRVVVVSPPDCPLLISSVDTEQLSAHHFELGIVVVNVGVQPISSYAITYSEYSGQSLVGSGCEASDLGIIVPRCAKLGSGQSNENELGVMESPQAIDRVEVAVDFVEFADRTTWGPDVRKNAQRLAGVRAGAREAQAYLRGVFQCGGDHGLTSAVATEHLPLEPPKNSSPEWERGFKLGVDTIRWRVKEAVESEGSEAAAKVLSQLPDS